MHHDSTQASSISATQPSVSDSKKASALLTQADVHATVRSSEDIIQRTREQAAAILKSSPATTPLPFLTRMARAKV